MNKNLDVVEDIKQNITVTDKQYKTIMESLMVINNTNKLPLLNNNPKLKKTIDLFNWLDTKLIITDLQLHCIKKPDLHKYVINNYFDNNYYENIDTVKQFLKFYFTYSTEEKSKMIIMNISLSNVEINTMLYLKILVEKFLSICLKLFSILY